MQYWVHRDTGSLQDAIDYARHAHMLSPEGSGVFVAKEPTDPKVQTIALVQYRGRGRGRGGFRGRGRGRGRGGPPADPYQQQQSYQQQPQQSGSPTCWNCGRQGHISRDCHKKQKEQGGGQVPYNPNSTQNPQYQPQPPQQPQFQLSNPFGAPQQYHPPYHQQ